MTLPLCTSSLIIRLLVPGDAATLLALSREPMSRKWLPSQVYRDEAHAAAVLEHLIRAYSTPADPRRGPYVLAIEDRADDALIGHVGFSPLEEDVEIGFAIAMNRQRRGLASEAVVAACRWAFETFRLERIVAVTSAENAASRRTLQRAGFLHREDKVALFQGSETPVTVYVLAAEPDARSAV